MKTKKMTKKIKMTKMKMKRILTRKMMMIASINLDDLIRRNIAP